MLNQVSIAAAGFSIIALILLLFQNRTESRTTKFLANVLLYVLISIQLLQVLFVMGYVRFETLIAFFYLLCLGLVGPLFYLYSLYVIHSDKMWTLRENGHFLPVIVFASIGLLFPEQFNLVYTLMFLLGGVYMSWLAWSLYQLRERRSLFRMEFMLTASFLGWAMVVALVGVSSIQTIEFLFPAQIIMLALAIAAAVHIQLNYPHLLSSLEEFASRQYQTSTLLNVDCDLVKQQLEELMSETKVYRDSELSLSSLAEMLALKPHQLSELINTQLGLSFSSYLRNHRIKAAEALLKNETEVSVLAIGLDVGFSSQSAFYTAFKEVHSVAPGQYRRQLKSSLRGTE
jgi:AraC-like DNA-binding protein